MSKFVCIRLLSESCTWSACSGSINASVVAQGLVPKFNVKSFGSGDRQVKDRVFAPSDRRSQDSHFFCVKECQGLERTWVFQEGDFFCLEGVAVSCRGNSSIREFVKEK